MIDIIDGVINDVFSQIFKNLKSNENLPFENEILKIPPNLEIKTQNPLEFTLTILEVSQVRRK